MIGKTISHYKILEKLPSSALGTGPSTALRTGGEGGMGVVIKQEMPASYVSLRKDLSKDN